MALEVPREPGGADQSFTATAPLTEPPSVPRSVTDTRDDPAVAAPTAVARVTNVT
jgi:hypothetical protein